MPSAFDRLLWAVNLLARNGFLVIPVSQLEQDPTLMEDRTQWVEVDCSASLTLFASRVLHSRLGPCMSHDGRFYSTSQR